MDQLIYQSATKIAQAIRTKKISSKEVAQTCIDRIKAINPKLNAVVQILETAALIKADQADQALASDNIIGPLHGVPMTLKDSFDSKDVISTGGTLGRKSYVPPQDATVLDRLKKAGAVLIGKTNTPELTLSYDTDNLIYGQTNNPYNLNLSPGGSSGGAAAILAAGGSFFDTGSDYGGSLRYPSHCCGIATIKPTSGRVPRTGHILPFGGFFDSFQQIGPMARYVEDLNLLLPILCGPDNIDPAIVPMPLGDPDRVDIKDLRVAFHTDNGILSPDEEIQQNIRQAAKVLEKAGASIVEIKPDGIEKAYDIMMDLMAADGGASTRRLLKAVGTKDHSLPWLDGAQPIDASAFDALILKWDCFRSSMLSFFKDFDIILCPVNAFCALPHGSVLDKFDAFSYTMAYNLTGWPAGVVRSGSSSAGMPIGVQIVSRPWREDICLAAAQLIETQMEGFVAPILETGQPVFRNDTCPQFTTVLPPKKPNSGKKQASEQAV